MKTPHMQMALFDAWRNSSLREPAMMMAEVAFLVTITSADNVVSMIACKALRAIAAVEQMIDAPGDRPVEQSARRYPIYEQLGNVRVAAVGMLSHGF